MLASDLARELSETFTSGSKDGEVQSMICAVNEELWLAFVPVSEERRTKEEAKALGLERDARRKAKPLKVDETKLGPSTDGDE